MVKRKGYAKIFKSRIEALAAGRNALKKLKFVSGTRGGKIKSSQAIIFPVKAITGYSIAARRK